MASKGNVKDQPQIVSAIYLPANLQEYAGNPLYEALPQFLQAHELVDKFGRFPSISKSERNLSATQRMLAVSRLNNYFEPLPSHFEVFEQINLILRAGYAHRNPAEDTYRKALINSYRQSMEGQICPIGTSVPSTAPSFALFGVSGVGKSTVVERTLNFLPQAINHENHHFIQVVWLKLDCPLDGSLKQLLLTILDKLDALLGTTYYKMIGRTRTIDELILTVVKIVSMHHLGVLVIDEIQNLLDASGVGQAKMLNFFVTFANEVKIPLITVGTPRALSLLEGTFREARRVGECGTFIWNSLSLGEEWSFFLEGLWKYQWTMQPVPLTPGFSKLMHEQTQGIHALVVRLFQLSQMQAIRTGVERLTEELITDVAADKFKLVAPMLNALRKGDKTAIQKYEDLLNKGLHEIKIGVESETNIALLKEQAQKRNQASSARVASVSSLISMGFEESLAQAVVTDFFDANPSSTCSAAVRAILEKLEANVSANNTPTGEGLKEIVQTAMASGQSPEKALSSVGLIASPNGKV